MSSRHTPTVRLRRLAAELRRLREAAEMTREDVAARTSINEATLYRIETAKTRPQARTLAALCDVYVVSETRRVELVALSKEATQRGWMRSFPSELPEQYTTYIGFEAEAQSVWNYESLFVPGLLQTEDYAQAVIRGVLPMASRDEVESRVQARMARQQLLVGKPPLRLWAILDEAAVRRRVGGPQVMLGQLRHLTQAAELPHVTIQIIPFQAGAHPGMPGSFAILQFSRPDPDVVYVDSMAGDLFLEKEADLQRYTLTFEHLRAVALSPDGSCSLVAAIAEEVME